MLSMAATHLMLDLVADLCDAHEPSNQSLEPTAGRSTKKVEGGEMIVDNKAKFAGASDS
jgi:hypothetical protein